MSATLDPGLTARLAAELAAFDHLATLPMEHAMTALAWLTASIIAANMKPGGDEQCLALHAEGVRDCLALARQRLQEPAA